MGFTPGSLSVAPVHLPSVLTSGWSLLHLPAVWIPQHRGSADHTLLHPTASTFAQLQGCNYAISAGQTFCCKRALRGREKPEPGREERQLLLNLRLFL